MQAGMRWALNEEKIILSRMIIFLNADAIEERTFSMVNRATFLASSRCFMRDSLYINNTKPETCRCR
jgi:hypothetical protein